MKAEIKPNETNTKPHTYPYLGHANLTGSEYLVLFVSPGNGITLTKESSLYGKYTNWDEDAFNLFNGTVTLSN